MRLPHHLHQHPSGIFYFRIVVPIDLHASIGKKIIKKSLQTRDPVAAKQWAYLLSSQYLAQFWQSRTMKKPTLEEAMSAAAVGKDYTITLPNGTTITANDKEDHSRAIESIGLLHKMGALNAPVVSSSSNQSNFVPTKLLLLSSGIHDYLVSIKPHTVKKTFVIKSLALNEFKKWRGDKNLPSITRADLAEYTQQLSNNGLAKPTITNKLSYIKSFFKAMQAGGYYPKEDNPAQGQMTYGKADQRKRKKFSFQPFPTDDLKIIFEALKKKTEHHYWAPIIGLYTGARVNEVCQLALTDFITSEGISCIRITNEGAGQSLKNSASERTIPLHPTLIKLGLLQRVEQLRTRQKINLFPKLTNAINGFGDAESKAFMRLLKKHNLKPAVGKKGFHSFRHTLIHKLQDHKVSPDYRAQYVGHDLSDEHFNTYSRNITMKELAEVIFPALDDFNSLFTTEKIQ